MSSTSLSVSIVRIVASDLIGGLAAYGRTHALRLSKGEASPAPQGAFTLIPTADLLKPLNEIPTVMRPGTDLVPPLCYEVTRIQSGKILQLREHMERLRAGLKLTFFLADENHTRVDSIVRAVEESHFAVQKHNDPIDTNIKVLLWGLEPEEGETDNMPMGFCTYLIKSHFATAKQYEEGVTFALLHQSCRHGPKNAKMVQSNLRLRAANLQKATGAFECLMVDGAAPYKVPEGTRSNYIVVTEGGEVWTSSFSDVLVGVTVSTVKKVCQQLNIPFLEKELTLPILLEGLMCTGPDRIVAMAQTGTSVGVLPVHEIFLNELGIEGDPAPQSLKLIAKISARPGLEVAHTDQLGTVLILSSEKQPLLARIRHGYDREVFN